MYLRSRTRLDVKYFIFLLPGDTDTFSSYFLRCLFLLPEPTEQMCEHRSKVKGDEGYRTFEEGPFIIKSREPESPPERETGNMMLSVPVHQSNISDEFSVLLRRQVTYC